MANRLSWGIQEWGDGGQGFVHGVSVYLGTIWGKTDESEDGVIFIGEQLILRLTW